MCLLHEKIRHTQNAGRKWLNSRFLAEAHVIERHNLQYLWKDIDFIYTIIFLCIFLSTKAFVLCIKRMHKGFMGLPIYAWILMGKARQCFVFLDFVHWKRLRNKTKNILKTTVKESLGNFMWHINNLSSSDCQMMIPF